MGTRPAQGLDAIDYVDPTNFFTRRESVYFAAVTQALVSQGYDNSTLKAVPYDWRMHPSENPTFVADFQSAVEDAVAAAGGRPALIVAHSMGNPMTHYFLQQMSSSWKQAHVEAWLAACGPFDGAAVAVKAMLSGYDFGISILTNKEGLEIGPYLGGTFYLLPRSDSLWGTVVQTLQGKNFTASQLPSLLSLSGVQDAEAKYASAAADWSTADPRVPVWLVAGSLLATETGFQYDDSSFTYGPLKTTYGSGDGTVPLMSALLPNTTLGWNVQKTQIFPKVAHVDMLADSNFLTWLTGQLAQM